MFSSVVQATVQVSVSNIMSDLSNTPEECNNHSLMFFTASLIIAINNTAHNAVSSVS